MALGVRSTGSASVDGAGTWTLSKPAGVITGDLMIVGVSWDASQTMTPPGATWTAISTNVGNTTMKTSCWYRIAQVGDTSWAWSIGGGATLGGVCQTFSGNDSTQPDATGTTKSNTGASTITTNAVTIGVDQSWEVICVGGWNNGNASSPGFTAFTNGSTSTTPTALLYKGPLSPGSTGTSVVTESGSATGQVIATIPFSIKPPVSGIIFPQLERNIRGLNRGLSYAI